MTNVPALVLKDADLCVGWNVETPRRSARDWVRQAERNCEPPKRSERQHEPWNQARAESRWWQPNHEEIDNESEGVLCPHKCELAFGDVDASTEGWGRYRRGFVPSVQLQPDNRGSLNLFVCLSDSRGNALDTGNAGLGRFKVTISKGPAEISSSIESVKQVDTAEVHFEVIVAATSPLTQDGIAFWLNVQDSVTGRHVRRSPRRVRAFWNATNIDNAVTTHSQLEAAAETKTASSVMLSEGATKSHPVTTSWSQLLNAPQKNKNTSKPSLTSLTETVAPPTSQVPAKPEPNRAPPRHAAALQILGDLRGVHNVNSATKLLSSKQGNCIREILPPVRCQSKHAKALGKPRDNSFQLLWSSFERWADVCRRAGRLKGECNLEGFDDCIQRLLDKASCENPMTPADAKIALGTLEKPKVEVPDLPNDQKHVSCTHRHDLLNYHSHSASTDLAISPRSTKEVCQDSFSQKVPKSDPESFACSTDQNIASQVGMPSSKTQADPVKVAVKFGESRSRVTKDPCLHAESRVQCVEVGSEEQICAKRPEAKEITTKIGPVKSIDESVVTKCCRSEQLSCEVGARVAQVTPISTVAPLNIRELSEDGGEQDVVKSSVALVTKSNRATTIKARQPGVAGPSRSLSSGMIGRQSGSVRSGALSRMVLQTFPA
eukprot:gnl/MRDRNA2_/MRDRNA2_57516_c0_seq1.p1 gnl/MRDRNA2_/MRDRNA2_57516_c0~~gnl/MRDRNA2_/MRDRNA2_57516_c0_seq1.p1  ORF type:complete len:662 (+),score=92.08 gnl/MRDRNA2_/MRDRNA2_57516_c0_seq1:87-2072(+)